MTLLDLQPSSRIPPRDRKHSQSSGSKAFAFSRPKVPTTRFKVEGADTSSDDSDFGREDPSTDRRPLKQPAPNSSSAKTHLKPKPQKKPRILISTQENNEEEEDLRESLDSILGNESQAFRQAKLNLISENQSTVRFGKKRREVISILSSEAEEAEEEIKPTLHIKGEKEIGAVRRILKADNKLTLREARRQPDPAENVLLRFLGPDQEYSLGKEKPRSEERKKTMKDGRLVFKPLEFVGENEDEVKKDDQEDEDDATASEGDFEALPTIAEIRQAEEDDDTVDEDEDELVPVNAVKPCITFIAPSKAPSPPDLNPNWSDLRNTMGTRIGKAGRILEPGESDDDGEIPHVSSSMGNKGKTRISEHAERSEGKDKLKREDDQIAFDKARELGMKPDFPCSAIKQRKRPYSLDPDRPDIVVPIAISRFLRRYQRLGVQFLYDRYKGVRVPGVWDYPLKGGILGDDMGLGKTIQVTAFLAAIMKKTGTKQDTDQFHSRKDQVRARFSKSASVGPLMFGPTAVIVCPTSLVDNWSRELDTWGYFSVGRADGSSEDRQRVYKKYDQGFLDILILSHSIVVKDADLLSGMFFSVMVVDEAHVIKNPSAQKTIAMKNIRAASYFALTGTLIQNRYSEMWSILDFVSPGSFGTPGQWEGTIGQPLKAGLDHDASLKELSDKQVVMELVKDRILPTVFIRRTKASLVHELPDKNDQVIFCPLTPIQEITYLRLTSSQHVRQFLDRDTVCPKHPGMKIGQCCQKPSGKDPHWKGLVLKYLTAFQKIASHVGLIYPYKDDKPEQKISNAELMNECFPPYVEGGEEESPLGPLDNHYRQLRSAEAAMDKNLSGKWLVLESLLLTWRADPQAKNKVLVFSKSVRLLKMLEFWLNIGGFSYEMLHGGHSQAERQESVDAFQNGEAFVFLISTLAGGVGLNLTAANKVVIFDPSWNPANDLQAMDRAFRMGQKRDVDVYRLIATGTLEENMYERQLNKRSAARTLYEGTAESRLHKGHEGSKNGRGTKGDLWGVENLFKYTPGGTVTDRVTRLAMAEDEVLRSIQSILLNKGRGKIDLNNMKVRPTEIDYEGAEEGIEVEETLEGVIPKYDEEEDESQMLGFLNLDFPGIRTEAVASSARISLAEKHIQSNAKEQYLLNKNSGSLPAFEYFKSNDYLAQEKKRKSLSRAIVGRKAPKLGKGSKIKSLIEEDDDDDD